MSGFERDVTLAPTSVSFHIKRHSRLRDMVGVRGVGVGVGLRLLESRRQTLQVRHVQTILEVHACRWED